ncbi:hypothetical protein [Actinoplanes teichomyceticus]|uniref:Uncharacterized protein n=1 Tax=Actinoplanes teichomyceticus TaxID=1867 RepID=A0A561VR81_ACTTI|nr:hypothetical protein [Actinoplanes teichomyceticus]TWG14122.1 hypothetical protein FHX34_104421 [Actinoplanes teichomyceticus]GIF13318.1 hypothetical protein Ate01nite_33500 [Actinoplanes teichomyceticus]
MRQAYAHHATIVPARGADPGAPSVAITGALRDAARPGSPFPHHTATAPDGDRLRLRVLFATEPDRVDEIRARIDAALAAGPWQLTGSGCARLDPDERPHARRLLRAARTAAQDAGQRS